MTRSNRWTILGSLSLVATLAFSALGCNQDGSSDATRETTEATTQQVADTSAPTTTSTPTAERGAEQGRGRREGGREGGSDHGSDHGAGAHRGPQGPDFLFRAALHELDLTDAQKGTIETALEGLRPSRDERPAPDATRLKALADSVRAGKVDVNAVPMPRPDAAQRDAFHAKMVSALTTLHDTLTTEQRRTLVDLVQKKADEHRPPTPDVVGEGKDGKDGKEGNEGNAGPERTARHERGGRPGPGDRVGDERGHGPMGLLRDLDLTDAQKTSLHQAMEARRPSEADRATHEARDTARKAEMKARLAAFVADSFDARAMTAPPAGAEPSHEMHGDPMTSELAVIVPLLTEAQRATLADRLEQPPPAREARNQR